MLQVRLKKKSTDLQTYNQLISIISKTVDGLWTGFIRVFLMLLTPQRALHYKSHSSIYTHRIHHFLADLFFLPFQPLTFYSVAEQLEQSDSWLHGPTCPSVLGQHTELILSLMHSLMCDCVCMIEKRKKNTHTHTLDVPVLWM